MGTRCNIQFIQGTEKYQLYQHWDGYPSWTLPFIQRFIKWSGNRIDDISYSVLNYAVYGKLESCESQVKSKSYAVKSIDKIFKNSKKDSNFSPLHTGYGITQVIEPNDENFSSLHIEWFYKIDLDKKTITILKPRYANFKADCNPCTYLVLEPILMRIVKFDEILSNDELDYLNEGYIKND